MTFLVARSSRVSPPYKLDPADGKPVAKIQLTRDDPEPHGLDISEGILWYCDAASGWICRLV